MANLSKRGQGLLIIAMIVVVAVLVLAMLYRIFIMTPAYVYQRSIYFVFKYNPQLVVQGLTMSMNTALYSFARSYSQFLLDYGVTTQLPSAEVLSEYYNMITNVVYEPTGLAIPVSNSNCPSNLTKYYYYGALSLLNYVYLANNYTNLYTCMRNTYNMPIIGIQDLTLNNVINLTARVVKPSSSTCIGNIHTITYLLTTKCTFNFITSTYACTNPAYNMSGQAMNLWAPYYNALASGNISQSSIGLVDVNTNYADPVVFLYPIDAVDANYGFKISAIFKPLSTSNFLVGINFLALYPTAGDTSSPSSANPSNYQTGYWVSVYPNGSKYYYVFGGPNISQPPGSISSSGFINITVVVNCNGICNPFQSPSGIATIYINNNQVGSIDNIQLPYWHLNTNTYVMTSNNKTGPWVVIELENAVLINATIRLINTYTLPTNVYVAVSMNGQPALGTQLSILTVSPTNKPSIKPAQYIVCNITSNAIIFNITMPQPIGYSLNQYLLLINYSGIVTVINPWLQPINVNGNVVNTTAMAAYAIGLYNSNASSLYEVLYVANYGVPTLISFYDGLGILNYNYTSKSNYTILAQVSPAYTTIQPITSTVFKKYTARELLISLLSGYTPLNYTIPQNIINSIEVNGLISGSWFINYSPLQAYGEALPITFAPTTKLNSNLNIELFFVRYRNYWGYYGYGSLQYNNVMSQLLNSGVGVNGG